MDNSFISVNKMSKKARTMMAKQNRNMWTMNPVSRVKQSAKIYNRKRKWMTDAV